MEAGCTVSLREKGCWALGSNATSSESWVRGGFFFFFFGHTYSIRWFPGQGESELPLQAYITATAMLDPQPNEQGQGSNRHPHG